MGTILLGQIEGFLLFRCPTTGTQPICLYERPLECLFLWRTYMVETMSISMSVVFQWRTFVFPKYHITSLGTNLENLYSRLPSNFLTPCPTLYPLLDPQGQGHYGKSFTRGPWSPSTPEVSPIDSIPDRSQRTPVSLPPITWRFSFSVVVTSLVPGQRPRGLPFYSKSPCCVGTYFRTKKWSGVWSVRGRPRVKYVLFRRKDHSLVHRQKKILTP